jgi:CRP-like cAMP-binding protein/HEAT repeat protein
MQGLLRKLLNLKAGEGRKASILYILGLVIATSLVWGGAIARGLFLKQVGIEWLPLMFILEALLTLPVTMVYAALVDRVSNARLLAIIFGGVGAILLAAWGLLLVNEWLVAIPYIIAVYALFYLADRLLRTLFNIHAWTFFNDYLDTRAAKRVFPILGSTSRLAGIVGGALVSLMARLVSAQNLVLAWVAVMGVGAWLSVSIPHWLAADRQPSAFQPNRRTKSPFATYWENLRGGFRFVSASTFLRVLAIGALAMTALLVLVDYQSQRIFAGAYPTAAGLVGFYGTLEMVVNLIALPVQMFLLSRLVSWLGVAQVNLFFPVGSLIIYAALSLWPSLGTAMAGQFDRDTFRTTVQGPVDNMLYNAVPVPVKGRARAFIKGLLLPLATVTIGLVLLPIQGGDLPWWVIGIGGAAALVQVIAAWLVRHRYTQALVTMLAEEDFSAYRLAGSELGPPDPATFQRLLERLRAATATEDEDFALFLARIVAEVGGREACPRLVEIAKTASARVRAGILETLLDADIADETALALSRGCLTAEDSRERRAALAILERLMGTGNPELWSLVVPLSDDPDPDTRVPAILLLARCGDFFYLAEAVRSLNELLSDPSRPHYRAAGLRVLQAMGDARMVRNLVHYVDDPDDGVRLQAAQAIEALANPGAPAWVVSLARETLGRQLEDPVEGVRLSALRTLGRVGGEGALERLIDTLADPSDLVREQAGAGLMALGDARQTIPALERVLDDEGSPEQKRLAAAVVLGQMARDRSVSAGDAQHYIRRVQDLFEATLRHVYADVRLIVALADLKSTSSPPASHSLPDLDALLPVGKRRTAVQPGLVEPRPVGLPALRLATGPGSLETRPADGACASLPAAELLCDGLRQRNERRLETALQLLSATLRNPLSTVDVIARTLREGSANSPARANALEALEALTSPRLARLVGQLLPARRQLSGQADGSEAAELVATGRQEWGLEPVGSTQALEIVLNDPDRWLAAIGIVLVSQAELCTDPSLDSAQDRQEKLFAAENVRDVWLPLWQADPDPAVQEAARHVARLCRVEPRGRMEVKTGMVETTQMAGPEALSTVEQVIFLKQIPFFAAMTVDQLRTLAGIAEEQYYDEGEIIFAEGDPGEALYVVVSGRVGIEREPKHGRVQRLETLAARQYFGERSIFDGASHETRAVALDRVHLLAIRREPLLALIRRSPDLSLSLVTVLSQRLREADSKLAARTRTKPDQVMRLYDRLTTDEE